MGTKSRSDPPIRELEMERDSEILLDLIRNLLGFLLLDRMCERIANEIENKKFEGGSQETDPQ